MELFLKIYFLMGISLAITKFFLVVYPTLAKLKETKELSKAGINNVPLFIGIFYIISFTWIMVCWIDLPMITLTKERLEQDIKSSL